MYAPGSFDNQPFAHHPQTQMSIPIRRPRHGNLSSTAWDCEFHGVGLRVPKPGTASSKAWDCEFQSLGLRVPKPGTASSTVWEPLGLAKDKNKYPNESLRPGILDKLGRVYAIYYNLTVNPVFDGRRPGTHADTLRPRMTPFFCRVTNK